MLLGLTRAEERCLFRHNLRFDLCDAVGVDFVPICAVVRVRIPKKEGRGSDSKVFGGGAK